MIRLLYRWLLWLHPPRFRREFAGEMLWIFDCSLETTGRPSLFADALVSLARQWLLRSGFWKIALAVAGGLLQVMLGGLAVHIIGGRQVSFPTAPAPIAASVGDLVRIGACLVPAVIVPVVLLALWTRRFTQKRMRSVL
jgi:hypothetical protein